MQVRSRRFAGSAVAPVLVGASLWGMIGPTYALIQNRVAIDNVTLVTLRAVGAALLCLIWFGARDRSSFHIARSDVGRIVVFGLVSVTAFYLVLIYAFRYSSVAVGTLLLYLAPALVTLGAALWLDDPMTRIKIAALILPFVGCFLIVEAFRPGNLAANMAGIGFGPASAVAYGSYSLMAKRLMRQYSAGTLMVWYLAVGASPLLLVKLAVSPAEWPSFGTSVGIALYSGVMITILPVAFYTYGLQRMPSSEASITATIEPVVAMVLAFWLLGERLGPIQLAGAMCVIGRVVLLAAVGRRNRVARVV